MRWVKKLHSPIDVVNAMMNVILSPCYYPGIFPAHVQATLPFGGCYQFQNPKQGAHGAVSTRIPTQTSKSKPATNTVFRMASCRLRAKAIIFFMVLIITGSTTIGHKKGTSFPPVPAPIYFTLCYAAGVGVGDSTGILMIRQPSLMSTRYTRMRLRPRKLLTVTLCTPVSPRHSSVGLAALRCLKQP